MVVVRRSLLAVLCAGAAAVCFGGDAQAAYPERPIRFILSHPPGGRADVIARLMQPKLEKLLSVPAAHTAGARDLPTCQPTPSGGCGLPQCGLGGCMME